MSAYRNVVIAEGRLEVCERCGFSNIKVLEVHHKDRDRSNSSTENLEVLCPNCHKAEHIANRRPHRRLKVIVPTLSYTLRIPDDLRRLMQGDADKRGRSLAQTMIAACWAQLERGSSVVEQGAHNAQDVGSIPTPATKLDAAELQEMVSGKMQELYASGKLVNMQDVLCAPDSAPLCPHKERCEDGEEYRCALVAGHKGKCKLGERVE